MKNKFLILFLILSAALFADNTVLKYVTTTVGTFPTMNSYVTSRRDSTVSLQIGNNWYVTGRCSVSTNIDLFSFVKGARFYGSVGSGHDTLVICKQSARPMHQIFDTSVTVVYNSGAIDFVNQKWFGKSNNNHDYIFVQRAVNSLKNIGGTILLTGNYNWGDSVGEWVQLYSGITIRGSTGKDTLSWSNRPGAFFFKADTVSNVNIDGLITVFGVPIRYVACNNGLVKNCKFNGYRGATALNMCQYAVWSGSSNNIVIQNNHIVDFVDGAYYAAGASFLTDTTLVRSTGCKFLNNYVEHVNRTYYAYPTGVQSINSKDVIISGNTFKDIVPGNTVANRTGYGIYEGDGITEEIICTDNIIINSTDSIKFTGIGIARATNAVVSNNVFKYKTPGVRNFAIGTGFRGKNLTISGNVCNGCGIMIDYSSAAFAGKISVIGNTIDHAWYSGIRINGTGTTHQFKMQCTGNIIDKSRFSGIHVSNVNGSNVVGNTITDCNIGDTTGLYESAGIVFQACRRSVVVGNSIENLDSGKMRYGVSFNNNGHTTKWIYKGNSIIGAQTAPYYSGYTAAPYGSQWDKGEVVENTAPTDTGELCWTLGHKDSTTLKYAAANGANKIVVNSVTNLKQFDYVGTVLANGNQTWSTVTSLSTDTAIITPVLDTAALISGKVYITRWRSNLSKISQNPNVGFGTMYPKKSLEIQAPATQSGVLLTIGTKYGWNMRTFESDSSYRISKTNDFVNYTDYLKLSSKGSCTVSDTTSSTSSSTGALVVSGGAGFGKTVTAKRANLDTSYAVYDSSKYSHADSACFGNGVGKACFSSHGHLSLYGAAMEWDDMDQFILAASKNVGATGAPPLNSTGDGFSEFQFGVGDSLEGGIEHGHRFVEGDTLHFHIHWLNANKESGDKFVAFSIHYKVRNIGDSITYTNTITAQDTITSNTSTYTHHYLEVGEIAVPNIRLGANIALVVKRIAPTPATNPTNGPFLLQVGIHKKIDCFGSQYEMIK